MFIGMKCRFKMCSKKRSALFSHNFRLQEALLIFII